ncbi:MAG: hypothetical protein AAF658_15075, partial [Myxococcota bacterium]
NAPLVRSALAPTVEALRERLTPVASTGPRGTQAAAARVLQRLDAVLRGERQLESDPSSPLNDVFAGTVRVAPSDTPPWPFRPPIVRAPRALRPLKVEPLEWLGEDGERVFGWLVRD